MNSTAKSSVLGSFRPDFRPSKRHNSCKWFSYPNGIEPFLSIVKLFIAEESLIQDANKALAHRLSSLQRRNISKAGS